MAPKVIPVEAIPDKVGRMVKVEGKDYLVMNDAMFTFYQRSLGELTPFFVALRDEKKILGCRCPSCGIVRVPPMVTRCPDCHFVATELIEVGQVGQTLSTPPITYFANSLFQQQVPFGRGRIILEGADTALSVNFYTTKGILVPGIVKKGTKMKVVFRKERVGEITDIFCVPADELGPEQLAKPGLEEGELDWERAEEPGLPAATSENVAEFTRCLGELKSLVAELNACERARRDIADWYRTIRVRCPGGELGLRISDGNLEVLDSPPASFDFTMVAQSVELLIDGLGYRGSLTQAIMNRQLWISKNVEFTTVFKLERMARSLARSKKT